MKTFTFQFRILEALTGLYEYRSYADESGVYVLASEAEAEIASHEEAAEGLQEEIKRLDSDIAAYAERELVLSDEVYEAVKRARESEDALAASKELERVLVEEIKQLKDKNQLDLDISLTHRSVL